MIFVTLLVNYLILLPMQAMTFATLWNWTIPYQITLLQSTLGIILLTYVFGMREAERKNKPITAERLAQIVIFNAILSGLVLGSGYMVRVIAGA